MRRFAQANAPHVVQRVRGNPTLTFWLAAGPLAALLALLA